MFIVTILCPYVHCHYTEIRYAECCYAECHGAFECLSFAAWRNNQWMNFNQWLISVEKTPFKKRPSSNHFFLCLKTFLKQKLNHFRWFWKQSGPSPWILGIVFDQEWSWQRAQQSEANHKGPRKYQAWIERDVCSFFNPKQDFLWLKSVDELVLSFKHFFSFAFRPNSLLHFKGPVQQTFLPW
jgi:hypothetical protein